MGRQCPECNSYEPQKRVITADFGPARKAEDVIAFELACGHTIGGEEYTEYEKVLKAVNVDIAGKQLALERTRKERLSMAYAEMKAKVKK